jgi:hypothetical protein
MAPEQLAGKKVDQRADIFSLGSVFYELVTRQKPFLGDVTTILYKIMHEDPVAPSLVNPALPGGIDAVIRRALAKEPKERFQKCEEMRNAFAEQAGRLNISPAAVGPMAMPAAKPKAQPSTPLPSFLLTEPAPKRRSIWPIALMLLFVGTAGWAFYVRSSTGSYPAFVNTLVGASHQSQPTGKTTGQSAQGDRTNDGDASANNVGTQPAPTTDNAPGTVAQTDPGDSNTETSASPTLTGVQSGSPATDGDGTVAATSQAPQPAGTATPTQPITMAQSATGIPPTPSAGVERSPFSPAGSEAQKKKTDIDTQTKKPVHQSLQTVDGFTKKNVPELLRVADTAARRGDYRLARYEYNLILKLDHNNATARTGLRLIQSAEQLH